ncbi:MAG: hypothetical protein IH988_04015 [Planctomycetes bacterium]|nr:hypothetical protein [Planctomycetota bacterium]
MLRIPLEEWDPANVYYWGLPGERIRKKISAGVPQLRELSKGRYPTLLVILNTVDFWPELADAYAGVGAWFTVEDQQRLIRLAVAVVV